MLKKESGLLANKANLRVILRQSFGRAPPGTALLAPPGGAPGARKRSPRIRVTILSRPCRRQRSSNEHGPSRACQHLFLPLAMY